VPELEQPLSGGNINPDGVVKVGDTVRRVAGPWTPAVHALLRHLAAGAYPAPVPLGLDERGREILSFVPGEPVWPDRVDLVRSSSGLRRAGRLVADYHDAQQSFVAPAGAAWRNDGRDPSGSEEVLAHNDLAPWNLIAGPAWTFIDWDLVAPGRRRWDLAWALHTFAGLWPDSGYDDREVVERVGAFSDGARVARRDRPGLLATVVERTRFAADEIRRRAARGEPAYVRLAADGHADS
jgi:Ser/Thr protein kinase RdoA (MazF antagonist)